MKTINFFLILLAACAPVYFAQGVSASVNISSPGIATHLIVGDFVATIEPWQGGALTLNPNAINRDLDFPSSYAMLAHNDLWGAHFDRLAVGDEIILRFDDQSRKIFIVSARLLYRALRPWSSESDYIEVATGTKFSALEWAYHLYGEPGRLTLATCDFGGLYRQAIFAREKNGR